jgi:hypothetical protein
LFKGGKVAGVSDDAGELLELIKLIGGGGRAVRVSKAAVLINVLLSCFSNVSLLEA